MYCQYPMKISVKSATYGLPSRHCHAYLSLPIVKEFCEGEGSCSIKAANNVFGDPCRGVRKCLQVKWGCIHTDISKQFYPNIILRPVLYTKFQYATQKHIFFFYFVLFYCFLNPCWSISILEHFAKHKL